MSFYTVSNMMLLLNIFKDFLEEKHDIDFEINENVKKEFYTFMSETHRNNPNSTLQEMNTEVLAKVKKYYFAKLGINNKKPQLESLNRDKSIYGDRPMQIQKPVPEPNPYHKKTSELQNPVESSSMLDRLQDERKKTDVPRPKSPNFLETVETVPGHDEFLRKLNELQEARNKIQIPAPSSPIIPPTTSTSGTTPLSVQSQQSSHLLPSHSLHSLHSLPAHTLYSPAQGVSYSKNIKKYLSINSENRNRSSKNKWHMNVVIPRDIGSMESISVHKVIITAFPRHVSVPYISLCIDELDSNYISNDQQEFCKLLIDKENSFVMNNGRNVTVMKACQEETKWFNQGSVPRLDSLTVSFRKPNGDLIATDEDFIEIENIEWDKGNLLISLKNEYDISIGDNVIVNSFKVTKLVSQQNEEDIEELNLFLNRKSGHDVIEVLGSKHFKIDCPECNTSLMDCLTIYNLNKKDMSEANGTIINRSLQYCILMALEVSMEKDV